MNKRKVREAIEDIIFPWIEEIDEFFMPLAVTAGMQWKGKTSPDIIDEIMKKIDGI